MTDEAEPSSPQRRSSFHASVELQDNPDLRVKPVAIGGPRERRWPVALIWAYVDVPAKRTAEPRP